VILLLINDFHQITALQAGRDQVDQHMFCYARFNTIDLMSHPLPSGILRTMRVCVSGCLLLAGTASAQQFSVTSWGHKDGLPSTTIYAITQTNDGFLWLGTSDGLIRFDGFQFTRPGLPRTPRPQYGQITALCPLESTGLLFGTSSGLLVRWSAKTIVSLQLEAAVESIKPSGGQLFKVQTAHKTYQVRGADLAIVGDSEDHNKSATAMLQFADSKETLNSLRNHGYDVSDDSLRSSHTRSVLTDSRGAVWVATENQGLFRVARQEDPQHFMRSLGLPSDHVWSLFEDREGNIWAGTQNGLVRLRQDKFATYTLRNGLASDIATALAPALDGGIWVGSAIGLQHFTGDSDAADTALQRFEINFLLPAIDGTLWTSTGTGLRQLTAKGIPLPSFLGGEVHIDLMAQSQSGDFWLYGTRSGLWHWDGRSKPHAVNEPELSTHTITSMRGGPDDSVWLGLDNGELILRPQVGSHVFTAADGLPGGSIRYLSPQADKTLWAASDNGLVYFDGERFRHWDHRDGLPGDRVLWVVPDVHDSLWLGYSTGVAHVAVDALLHPSSNGQALHVEFYDDGDGLQSNPEVYGSSPVVLGKDGRLWISMSEGVGMIDPRHVRQNSLIPQVHILELTADGHSLDPVNGIKIPPHTRILQISYTGISLTEPRKVRFRYRLEGFDHGWQEAGARRNAFYTNLRPGRYRFEAIASNNDGVWNMTGDSIAVELLPAFYQTPWFLTLCVALIASLAFVFYRLRLSVAQRELKARYEERMAERTRIAQDLHDNLVQEIVGISLQLDIADEMVPPGSSAKLSVERALVLSRQALSSGRSALHILRMSPLSSSDIESTLRDTVRSMNKSTDALEFLSSGGTHQIRADVGENLLQIMREAIRNSLEHSGQNKVTVQLDFDVRNLVVTIRDQGSGINIEYLKNGKPRHFGIQGMRERAARIDASLTVNIQAGTEWKLQLPASAAYDPADPTAESSLANRCIGWLRRIFKGTRRS